MDEELIKILVEKWALPEDMVRKFMSDLLEGKDPSIENIRESAVNLIHELILKN